jgi:hypothetical protein
MLPSVMLSGFIYPIRNMPLFLQGVTWLFPGRYLISALRALMLRDGTDHPHGVARGRGPVRLHRGGDAVRAAAPGEDPQVNLQVTRPS